MPDKIVVASHRRSGTHWTIDAIRNNFRGVRPQFLNLDRLLPWHESPVSVDEFKSFIYGDERAVIIKTHTPVGLDAFGVENDIKEFARHIIENSKNIYVYRDGRDVMVSLFHYMKEFNERDENISLSEFIREENNFDCDPNMDNYMNRIEYWRYHVDGWINKPSALKVSYEELYSNYEGFIARVEPFIDKKSLNGIRYVKIAGSGGPRGLQKILRGIRRIIGRRKEGVSSAVLPRKGTVGDWKSYFSSEDIALYNRITEGMLLDKER